MVTRKALALRVISVVAAVTTAGAFLSPGVGGPRASGTTPLNAPVAASKITHGTWAMTPPSPISRTTRRGILQMSDSTGIDTIINDLRTATDVESLTLKVSKNVKQVAQPAFFLRLAEMAETSADAKQKDALERLATQVTGVLQTLLEFAEEVMDDSSSLLQIIVTSAAEKNGEFLVPLSEERLAALRQSIKIHRDQLDNNFLATVQAWMEKSSKEENMEGMVVILQKVLQMYASQAILGRHGNGDSTAGQGFGEGSAKAAAAAAAKRTPASQLLDTILVTDAEKWDGIMAGLSTPGQGMTGGVTKDGLLGAIQVAVETVILQQENGSMAQRVQAEFLSELCKRIETACPDRPPGVM